MGEEGRLHPVRVGPFGQESRDDSSPETDVTPESFTGSSGVSPSLPDHRRPDNQGGEDRKRHQTRGRDHRGDRSPTDVY